MERKTAFIGHGEYFERAIDDALRKKIRELIASGCKNFIMGTHGRFDEMALYYCRQERVAHKDLKIEVVISNFNLLQKRDEYGVLLYDDVEPITYEIERVHYKNRIKFCNKKMIDECDTLICYVDENRIISNAVYFLKYARSKGKKIINVYGAKPDPSSVLTDEQIEKYHRILNSGKIK